ncbi:hypothetical protein ACFL5Q_06240 [Planctomycetota bacterium]
MFSTARLCTFITTVLFSAGVQAVLAQEKRGDPETQTAARNQESSDNGKSGAKGYRDLHYTKLKEDQGRLDQGRQELVRQKRALDEQEARLNKLRLAGRTASGTLGGKNQVRLEFLPGGILRVRESTAEFGDRSWNGTWSFQQNRVSMAVGDSTLIGSLVGNQLSGFRARSDGRQDKWSVTLAGLDYSALDRKLLSESRARLAEAESEYELRKREYDSKRDRWEEEHASLSRRYVTAAAYAFEDGGGYDKTWKGHGVPEDVVFDGSKILEKAKSEGGTYCSGFTFAVAMDAAQDLDLLEGKSKQEIRQFQREWYGTTSKSGEKQAVTAMENMGVGVEKRLADAQPGDYVMFWRNNDSGHSVVFLGWIEKDGERVGIRYRSSQGKTKGIGDSAEYFFDSKTKTGTVDRNRTYVGRLTRDLPELLLPY